jgi:hypothetical protein
MRKILVAVGLAGLALFTGTAAASSKNDRVLHEDKYIEVFKQEGKGGDKNYLYTITEFVDGYGRKCTVVTGASETAIALDCGTIPGGG